MHGGIVIDHQHGASGGVAALRNRSLLPRRMRRRPGAIGQHDGEGRALARLAGDGDIAAQHGREMPGDGEAEPGAAVIARGRGVGLGEGLEQPAHLLVAHADAGILDREGEDRAAGSRLRLRHRQRHQSALGEFRGIAEQVDQALLQLHQIDMHGADIGRRHDLEIVAVLVHQRRHQHLHFGRELAEIDLLDMQVHAAGLDLGQIENVVDQPEQMLAGGLDLDEVRLARLVAAILRVLAQNFAVADDGVERRAQLVAHIGEEGRLGAGGRFGLMARFFGFLARLCGSRAHCRGTPRAPGSCRRVRPDRSAAAAHRVGRLPPPASNS